MTGRESSVPAGVSRRAVLLGATATVGTGGYGGDYDAGAVKHTVRSSVAFLNKAAGFYANHHPVAGDFNNTGYGNRPNFNLLGVDSSGAAVGRGNLRNNLAYTGTPTSNLTGTNVGLPYNGSAPDLGAFENDGR